MNRTGNPPEWPCRIKIQRTSFRKRWGEVCRKGEHRKDYESREKQGGLRTALQCFNLWSEISKKEDKREILLTLNKMCPILTEHHLSSYKSHGNDV